MKTGERIGEAPVLLTFQTVMELRFGALRAGWGELRKRRLERSPARVAYAIDENERIVRIAHIGPSLSKKLPFVFRLDTLRSNTWGYSAR